MASPARSRRPHPAPVYWFRRLMVLGVALGLVFGVAQLLGRGSDNGSDQVSTVGSVPAGSSTPATTASAPSATADAEPPADETRTAGKRTGKKKRAPKPLPEPTGPCSAEEIVATPQIVGEAYAVHSVLIRVELTTRETKACNWTASASSMVVKLTSGDDRIWSSQDCPAAIPPTPVVVRKKVPATVDVTWRGQRSDETCSRTTSWAQPGWYHVEAVAFGSEEPTDLQFELTKAANPTITAEPTQKQKAKRD